MKDFKSLEKWMPFFVVILTFLFFCVTVDSNGTGYWYDEIIVTEISKQPLGTLIDTVKAEPHPPGFYIFLKLFPINNRESTRLLLAAVNTGLTLLAILYGNLTETLKEHKLHLPLAFLLATPFFTTHSITIKQEALSLPLLILGQLVALRYLETQQFKTFLILTIVTLITFSLGYINAAILVLAAIALSFYKPSKKKWATLAILCLSIATYFLGYGLEQFRINSTRFAWHKDEYQSLLSILTGALNGDARGIKSFYPKDVLILGGTLLFYKYITRRGKSKLETVLLYFFALYSIGAIFLLGIARSRYVSWLIMYFVIVATYQLQKTCKKKRELMLIGLVLVLSMGWRATHIFNLKTYAYGLQNKEIATLSSTATTGLVCRHPIDAHIRKLGYLREDKDLIPVNPFLKVNGQILTKETLALDSHFEDLNIKQVNERLRDTGLNRFIYITNPPYTWGETTYYDPKQRLLQVLSDNCKKKNLNFMAKYYLILFEECM